MLKAKLDDPEFLVRSFVSRAFGIQQTPDSFAALLQIMKFDNTPNVLAETANSLSLFGRCAASHLVLTFFQDDRWLVRRSILAVLVDMECESELFEVCMQALAGEDMTTQEAAVDALGTLAGTNQEQAALSQLLMLANSEYERMRQHVASALQHFDDPQAKEILSQLRQDSNHRVVATALEKLL